MLKHFLWIVFLLVAFSSPFRAQVAPSATGPASSLYVGGTVSAFQPYPNAGKVLPGYQDNTLLGVGAFIDLDFNRTRLWWGIEAEGHWLLFNEFAQVHEDTYMIGPRITVPMRRLRISGKALYGLGEFAFPYGYAHEQTSALAFGGGLDYRLSRKITLRVFDAEYQWWPNFQRQGISPFGASSGVAYHLR